MTMRPITFILCATRREAQEIAARGNLDNWRWLEDAQMIRGLDTPTVWRTPCWFDSEHWTSPAKIEIHNQLAITNAVVKTVDCPHGGRIPAADNA
jgi:hypothetical protein